MPQLERSPAFQFYPKDFLSDPNVMTMSNAQVGAYIKLICICWQQGHLPDDDAKLARLVGESPAWWKRNGEDIRRCFKPARKGSGEPRLKHPRLEAEQKRQLKYREQRSKAGKASIEKRRQKQQDTDGRSNSVGTKSNSPSPSPSPTPELVSANALTNNERARSVVDYLNSKTGRSYRKVEGTLALIESRLEEGIPVEDLVRVVDFKVPQWVDDPERSEWLRPSTLFGDKCEGYVEAAKAAESMAPLDLWPRVLSKLHNSGEASAHFDAATNAAVQEVGGWTKLGRMPSWDLSNLEGAFREAYAKHSRLHVWAAHES